MSHITTLSLRGFILRSRMLHHLVSKFSNLALPFSITPLFFNFLLKRKSNERIIFKMLLKRMFFTVFFFFFSSNKMMCAVNFWIVYISRLFMTLYKQILFLCFFWKNQTNNLSSSWIVEVAIRIITRWPDTIFCGVRVEE